MQHEQFSFALPNCQLNFTTTSDDTKSLIWLIFVVSRVTRPRWEISRVIVFRWWKIVSRKDAHPLLQWRGWKAYSSCCEIDREKMSHLGTNIVAIAASSLENKPETCLTFQIQTTSFKVDLSITGVKFSAEPQFLHQQSWGLCLKDTIVFSLCKDFWFLWIPALWVCCCFIRLSLLFKCFLLAAYFQTMKSQWNVFWWHHRNYIVRENERDCRGNRAQ